ncbi:hypothetical protein OUZ56_000187 [Daphnia magna]|uniref:Uncharacterized protein n=1 Tax=Daphnia magna TaxID=35525 RepID=A0ABQ9ZYY7_9CRUS|nr:hypothetical protein OUZ56_000187 [Daphnia magna]
MQLLHDLPNGGKVFIQFVSEMFRQVVSMKIPVNVFSSDGYLKTTRNLNVSNFTLVLVAEKTIQKTT